MNNSFQDGSLARAIITLVVLVGLIITYATKGDAPEFLVGITGTVVGYYFGKQDTLDSSRVIAALNKTSIVLLSVVFLYSLFT